MILSRVVDAEGADVNNPAQFAQARGFENIDRAENIIGRAGVRVFLHAPADQAGRMHQSVHVEFFQRAQQRRQIAHIGGDHVGFILANNFLEVIAIGREIEQNYFVAAVDGMARRI